jgi:DNA-binding NarL/FixJ family response regulator
MSSPHRRSGAQGSFVVAARSELLVRGLKSLVSEEPGLRVLGTATDAMGALQAIRTHRPDIVVVGVELAMPLERLIDRQDVSFRAILVSTRPFMPSNAEKETNNACSFFDSNAPVEQIRALIQISAQCRERQSGVNACKRCALSETLRRSILPLSPREQDVFAQIGKGRGNSEIASHLRISVKTVEAYREHIKAKLGLDSSFALNNAAVAWIDGRFPEERTA